MWNADNGALIFGSAFGRTLFVPKISPKKTLAGAVGGLVCCTLTVFLTFHLSTEEYGNLFALPVDLSFVHKMVLGLVLGAAAILGDLIESYMKRIAGIKDSGQFFPGHGGCLDRMDSMLLVAPLVYYWGHCIIGRT